MLFPIHPNKLPLALCHSQKNWDVFCGARLLENSINSASTDSEAPRYLGGISAIEQGQHLAYLVLPDCCRLVGDVIPIPLEFRSHCALELVGLIRNVWDLSEQVFKDAIHQVGLDIKQRRGF
jgi:hypothetical protein